ncbi:MAG: DUF2461 domain-containing protein, partial [Alphaproteobacteria bacterium]|nr:DUF2461 domain-containing protein [Alphaproteobacteria bacterium]
PPGTLKFLKALGFHQSREWFEENRPLYLADFKAPLEAYVEALSAECARRKLPLKGEARYSTFRLHRDVRFSKNKEPYKTNGGCVLTRSGRKGTPGIFYTHISPEGGFFACGFYHPEPHQLLALRQTIAAKPKAFLDLEAKLAEAKLEIVDREQLKRVPNAFSDCDPRIGHGVRMKNFITRRAYPEKLLQDGPKLVAAAVDFAQQAMPILKWGWKILDGLPEPKSQG